MIIGHGQDQRAHGHRRNTQSVDEVLPVSWGAAQASPSMGLLPMSNQNITTSAINQAVATASGNRVFRGNRS